MVRTALAWAGVTAVLLPALSGCSGTPHRSAVTAAARAFVQHVRAGEGDAACALLTDDARSSVPGATDQTCAEAIPNVKEKGSRVGSVAVWGDAAQVRIGTDVVFLRRMAGHWLVSAAGCKPQPDGPYDCEVGG